MGALNVDQIRKNFPALQGDFGGQAAVFADALGGTQVPQTVIDAMATYLATNNAYEHGTFKTSAPHDVGSRSIVHGNYFARVLDSLPA